MRLFLSVKLFLQAKNSFSDEQFEENLFESGVDTNPDDWIESLPTKVETIAIYFIKTELPMISALIIIVTVMAGEYFSKIIHLESLFPLKNYSKQIEKIQFFRTQTQHWKIAQHCSILCTEDLSETKGGASSPYEKVFLLDFGKERHSLSELVLKHQLHPNQISCWKGEYRDNSWNHMRLHTYRSGKDLGKVTETQLRNRKVAGENDCIKHSKFNRR